MGSSSGRGSSDAAAASGTIAQVGRPAGRSAACGDLIRHLGQPSNIQYMPVVGGWGPESQSLEPPEFYLRMKRSRNRWAHDWMVHCRRYRALGREEKLGGGGDGQDRRGLRSFTYHEQLSPNEGPEYGVHR